MPHLRAPYLFAVALSVGFHALVLLLTGHLSLWQDRKPEAEAVVMIDLMPALPERPQAPQSPAPREPADALPPSLPPLPTQSDAPSVPDTAPQLPAPDRPLARMEAPPAPTAQEWVQASTYTLKNSKRYRYTWGQQVRSMMGTAVEGPDQGMVRLRIEIAPDGTLVSVETLWSTSAKAEALARQAIRKLPPLPPTPTGQPLIFEKTISFQPFATDAPPIYKDDCLPDPPRFVNPYAWDGRSPPRPAVQPAGEKLDSQAMAECLQQLPQDSMEAEEAHDRRQLDQWGSDKLD
jgi:TonB family protein